MCVCILSKHSLLISGSHRFSPENFTMLHLDTDLIWLTFVESVKCGSRFIFCIWTSSCSSVICWKDCPFCTQCPLSKISWIYLCGCISRLSVLSHWSMCYSLANIMLCDYCSFIIILEFRWHESFNFVPLLYKVGYSRLLPFQVHFRIRWSISTK